MRGGVCISGIGAVTALGDDPLVLDANPSGGPRGERRGSSPIAAFDVAAYLQRKGMRHLSRTSQLACAAAARVAPALEGVCRDEVGVVIGSAWAALDTIVRFEREAYVEGPRLVDPLLFTETVPNVPAGQVSIVFGWAALNLTLGGGDAAGLEAVARAADLLDQGRAAVMVAGGVDALHEHLVRALEVRGEAGESSPSEASCLVVLERDESVRARGVRPLARVVGQGTRNSLSSDRRAARRSLLEELSEPSGIGALDLVVDTEPSGAPTGGEDRASDADRPTWLGLPLGLGRTWAASGPLGLAVAIAALRHHPESAKRTRHAAVISGTSDQLTGIRLELEPAPC